MRFTTWSTLINAFIISSVALLSWIQVANATLPAPSWKVDIFKPDSDPQDSTYYLEDIIPIRWTPYPYNNDNSTGFLEANGTIYLRNNDTNYYHQYGKVKISSGFYNIFYPEKDIEEFVPSNQYYIQMTTSYGNNKSNPFTIKYH